MVFTNLAESITQTLQVLSLETEISGLPSGFYVVNLYKKGNLIISEKIVVAN